jgi:hypothetical protein
MLAGPEYFLNVFWVYRLPILVMSLLAGMARLPFRRGGLALSAICGAVIAVAGFVILLAIAVSSI